MNTVLGLAIILLFGLISERLISRLKLPSVTAYILLGVALGPSALNWMPTDVYNASGLISNIVLGIIAFGIGQNFSVDTFRKIGKSVAWISMLEAAGAWLLVTFTFWILMGQPLYVALLFGAIAAATDPAATVMVINEYKAQGSFTNTLLGVVAVDDAWGLIIFALSLAISQALFTQHVAASFLFMEIGKAGLEIAGAMVLGAISAVLLSSVSKYLRSQRELLLITLGFVFLNIGLSIWAGWSLLLTNMFFGGVLVNINKMALEYFNSLKVVDSLFYLLFFVMAGAHMEIGMLPHIGIIGVAYLVVRVIGKVAGSYIGARCSNAPINVRRYLGWGLVPQAGVALACALVAKQDFPQIGNMLFTTILATTVIYELVGPLCAKYALVKAGDIQQ